MILSRWVLVDGRRSENTIYLHNKAYGRNRRGQFLSYFGRLVSLTAFLLARSGLHDLELRLSFDKISRTRQFSRKFEKAKVFLVSDRKRTPSGIRFGIQPHSHDALRDDVILVIQRKQEGPQRFRTQPPGSLTEGSRDSSDQSRVPCARAAAPSSVPRFLQGGTQMYAPHEPQADTIG
jgi:hypothetical protein